jgi:DNA processing protein
MTDVERLYAIAISLVSSPAAYNMWGMISTSMPTQIFDRISRDKSKTTQNYLSDAYSANPLEAAKQITEKAAATSTGILTYWDDVYPPLLREIQMPPLVLYVRGVIDAGLAAAVVGTRKSDIRSAAHARRIAGDLASCGFTVVSGMAVGIDREAHLGSLEACGKTIGILANGIDIIYPWANRDLYHAIAASKGSGLVSEYPPGIRAGKWTFVRRNRIISGLCVGTVVVKAGRRSGALITARHAVEQNREVFACVGNTFDDEYAGCHELIRNGAVLVSRSEDIITGLSGFTGFSDSPVSSDCAIIRKDDGDQIPAADAVKETNALQGRILLFVSTHDCEIDAIIRQLESPPSEVNEAIMELELSGMIIRNGNIISRL